MGLPFALRSVSMYLIWSGVNSSDEKFPIGFLSGSYSRSFRMISSGDGRAKVVGVVRGFSWRVDLVRSVSPTLRGKARSYARPPTPTVPPRTAPPTKLSKYSFLASSSAMFKPACKRSKNCWAASVPPSIPAILAPDKAYSPAVAAIPFFATS